MLRGCECPHCALRWGSGQDPHTFVTIFLKGQPTLTPRVPFPLVSLDALKARIASYIRTKGIKMHGAQLFINHIFWFDKGRNQRVDLIAQPHEYDRFVRETAPLPAGASSVEVHALYSPI